MFGLYARFASSFGTELEPGHATPDLLIVGVNTTRAWRHKHGEVSASQIARVATVLAKASAPQLSVVVVHQPMAVLDAGGGHDLLRGHAQATRAWAAAGTVLAPGDHLHLPFTRLLHGLARRLRVVQAGTAVSRRTCAWVPNSVNLLRWGRSCQIEHWDFDLQTQAFAPTLVTVVQQDAMLQDRESARRSG